MAARVIAPASNARNITDRELLALRAIRAGTMRAVLHHGYVYCEGGRIYTSAVMGLVERGIVRFADDGAVVLVDRRSGNAPRTSSAS